MSENEPGPAGVNPPPPGSDELVRDLERGEGLGARTARGGAVLLATQVLRQTISFGFITVLARLLSPTEYGLMGMVYTLTIFLSIFSDLGFSTATVQKDQLTHQQFSNMFWANFVFGVLVTIVTALLAPVAAWFYNEPVLLGVTLAYSINFALSAISIQHRALLRRRMQFGRMAACDLGGMALGGGVAIAMAATGQGVYALVAQALVMSLVTTVLAFVLAPFLPSWPRRRQGTMEMIKFGGYFTGFNVVNYFAREIDKILLGRFWGTAEVGVYTRAYTLMTYPRQLIADPMQRLLIPALSKVQNDLPRFEAAFLRSMRMLALISFPISAGLSVLGEEAILIVFGDRWREAIPIFRLLCVSGLFQGWGASVGWLFICRGKTREMFKWGMVATPLVAASFIPCVWYRGMGAAAGYGVVIALLIGPMFWYATKVAGIRFWPVMGTALGPLIATGAMVAVTLALKLGPLAEVGLYPRTAILIVVGAGSFSLAALVFCRATLFDVLGLAKQTLGWRKGAGADAGSGS